MGLFLITSITYLCFLNTAFISTYKVIKSKDAEPYKPMPVPKIDDKETEISYWREKGFDFITKQLNRKLNTNVAKNVIFFMGDGMSFPTITASRIYGGQLQKQNGEESKLFFETFPYVGLSKTYCVDRQVADSASTATAFMSGVKANFLTIGVNAKVKPADCESTKVDSNRPSTIIKWAQDVGKATGVLTTTRITHASPAGAYAHVPYREMECDADILAYSLDPRSCDFDIAKQLINDEPGKNIKVLMGGGRRKFLPESGSMHGSGQRSDKDLIQEWKNDKKQRNSTGVYITDVKQLEQLDINRTDYLLGLFADDHMSFHTDQVDQPTLPQMTETAIKLLQKEKNGFFLYVEGGLIDPAHHLVQARRALDETIEFDKAIQIAAQLTDQEDTLIVVTADHSHTMSISGYPNRGYDVLGIFGKSRKGHPYATLSYANGPGYKPESSPGVPHPLEKDDMSLPAYAYPSMVPKDSESHGGDDVAVFARGPWAHLFAGTYEQSYIPILEAFIANITIPGQPEALQQRSTDTSQKSSSGSTIQSVHTVLIFYIFVNLLRL